MMQIMLLHVPQCVSNHHPQEYSHQARGVTLQCKFEGVAPLLSVGEGRVRKLLQSHVSVKAVVNDFMPTLGLSRGGSSHRSSLSRRWRGCQRSARCTRNGLSCHTMTLVRCSITPCLLISILCCAYLLHNSICMPGTQSNIITSLTTIVPDGLIYLAANTVHDWKALNFLAGEMPT